MPRPSDEGLPSQQPWVSWFVVALVAAGLVAFGLASALQEKQPLQ